MAVQPGLITTAAGIEALALELRKTDIIAFDTEFIRESTFFPMVEILQVATETDSWLVDVQAFRRGREHRVDDLKPLLDVFTDKKILKILHAAQGDQECLYTAFGMLATPTLDTATAASLLGMGENMGLGNLTKQVQGITLKKGHGRTNWSQRPLPDQLLEYAHGDVVHLVDLGKRLLAMLDQKGRRDWALEVSAEWENPKRFETTPEDLALRLARGGRLDPKGYAVLLELVRWREARVRAVNVPRRWIADDPVLIDLAQVKPKDVGHLSNFRGLNKGELKNSGDAILDAIRRGESAQGVAYPKSKRPEMPNEDEEQVLDVLKCYLGILADRHEISSKNLVTAAQLLPILRSQAKKADDLIGPDLLNAVAARLVGDEIVAFLEGRRALSVEKNDSGKLRVKIVEVDSSN